MTNKRVKKFIVSGLAVLFLSSCGSQPEKKQTLASLDKDRPKYQQAKINPKKASTSDVKKAYYDYIKDADKDDKLRIRAATRIAELELSSDQDDQQTQTAVENKELDKKIHNTITLLEDTLHDFPNSSNNDHVMYQLAKAHDQVAQGDQAIDVLEQMVQRYPKTQYFIEAKFRIAEHAFVTQNYFKSEDAYTDVLRSADNAVFFEKALFKRGWARYKQELYVEALDDYYDAVFRHEFAPYFNLDKKEQGVFDEYFRAIGLSFSYLGGANAIHEYMNAKEDHSYAYETHLAVSQLFLKQERYSDAVNTHQAYIDRYPTGEGVIRSGLAIVNIWKEAGLFNRYASAFEVFYQKYQTQSVFWKKAASKIPNVDKVQASTSIRKNITVMASYNHKRFDERPTKQKFEQSAVWYQRYLKDYSSYARQDKIYPLYAELLNTSGRFSEALPFYEKAAFDGDIVLDKESAYSAIYLTDKLVTGTSTTDDQKKEWLDKHIRYAALYGELYKTEFRTASIIEHAVQLAFKNRRLDQAITLANLLSDKASESVSMEVGMLKAQSYFDLKRYDEAEIMYQDLLSSPRLSNKKRQDLQDNLALSFYRQAETEQEKGNTDLAARNFLKVYQQLPNSELAATALYDAIALFMSHNMWDEAIDYLNAFKQDYPRHPFQKEVGKKLSVAYLKSNRSLEAAKEFERLSNFVTSEEEKMAALWQAAKIYKEKGELESALRAYKQYANRYPRPYAQYMEAAAFVANIHKDQGQRAQRFLWLRKMTMSDKAAAKSIKTDRTRYLAANASYSMALIRMNDYQRIKLTLPLDVSLLDKKSTMQDSVKLFGQSAEYGHEEFVTNATNYIGDIYRDFSIALLESERPVGLSVDELEQYDILLEDQAFPFEDKAIEFYETNMTRIANGNFDTAIQNSLQQLQKLFPARYDRPGKIELFVENL